VELGLGGRILAAHVRTDAAGLDLERRQRRPGGCPKPAGGERRGEESVGKGRRVVLPTVRSEKQMAWMSPAPGVAARCRHIVIRTGSRTGGASLRRGSPRAAAGPAARRPINRLLRPYRALATVYIITPPLSGATHAKGIYHVGGTLAWQSPSSSCRTSSTPRSSSSSPLRSGLRCASDKGRQVGPTPL
jgi:hypothetical protein